MKTIKQLLIPTKLGLIVSVAYIAIVVFFWIDLEINGCGGLMCEMPLALTSWPIGIFADTHTIESMLGLPANYLVDEITIVGQLVNSFLFLILGNWIQRKYFCSFTSDRI